MLPHAVYPNSRSSLLPRRSWDVRKVRSLQSYSRRYSRATPPTNHQVLSSSRLLRLVPLCRLATPTPGMKLGATQSDD